MTHILEALETIEIPVDPAMKKSFEQQQKTSEMNNEYSWHLLLPIRIASSQTLFVTNEKYLSGYVMFQYRLNANLCKYVLFRNVSID